MTEHEQGPWTNEDITGSVHRIMEHHPGVGYVVQQFRVKSLCGRINDDWKKERDAWQADHDALVTANEQMATQIGDLATERDGLVAKLDAANARIAELKASVSLWIGVANDDTKAFNELDRKHREELARKDARIAELEKQSLTDEERWAFDQHIFYLHKYSYMVAWLSLEDDDDGSHYLNHVYSWWERVKGDESEADGE